MKTRAIRVPAILALALSVTTVLVSAQAKDIAGRWAASFDTQVGHQTYEYEFTISKDRLTGTARSAIGESAIHDGRIKGREVSFVEKVIFDGRELRIAYSGTILSPDEIRFIRIINDSIREEFVATRPGR